MGAVAETYMRKGFLIVYMSNCANNWSYMITRRPIVIYDFATMHSLLDFLIYEENFVFFFISEVMVYSIERKETQQRGGKNPMVLRRSFHGLQQTLVIRFF